MHKHLVSHSEVYWHSSLVMVVLLVLLDLPQFLLGNLPHTNHQLAHGCLVVEFNFPSVYWDLKSQLSGQLGITSIEQMEW